MNNPDFNDLLSHPNFLQKVALVHRLQANALAQKWAADDAVNARAQVRYDRRAVINLAQRNARERGYPVDSAMLEELAELDTGERAFQQAIREERQRADEQYQRASAPAVAALDWLGDRHADWRAAGRPAEPWLRYVAPPKAKRATVELVRELRAGIEALEEQILDVSRRPVTAAELKAETDATLAKIAERGALNADAFRRGRDPFGLLGVLGAEHFLQPVQYRDPHLATLGREPSPRPINGAAAVFVWLLEGELREVLHRRIDELDLADALSTQQQEKELEQLADRRLRLEREEEAAIVGLAEQGVVLDRRPGVDPRAMLECEVAY